MADHTDNGLRAVIKALSDVVAPAIDPADPLAREQLRLAVDYLEFVRARLDALYGRERFELQHAVTLAEDLLSGSELGERAALEAALAQGRALLGAAGSPPAALRAATAEISGLIRDVVRAVADTDRSTRAAVERKIISHAAERIRFERSWYLPLGFDPSPGDVDELAALLAAPEPTRP